MVATPRHRVTKLILMDKCAGSAQGKTAYFRKIKRPHRPTPVTSNAAVGRSESIARLVVVVLQLKPDILPLAHGYFSPAYGTNFSSSQRGGVTATCRGALSSGGQEVTQDGFLLRLVSVFPRGSRANHRPYCERFPVRWRPASGRPHSSMQTQSARIRRCRPLGSIGTKPEIALLSPTSSACAGPVLVTCRRAHCS